jgi:hypothetical protein
VGASRSFFAMNPISHDEQQAKTGSKLGWLKHGNPPGDPNTAKRCKAKSRRTGNPCGQPAMKNGCCRFHGGKSTGPRTPEGLKNAKKARWRHGGRSRQAKAFNYEARVLIREMKALHVADVPENHPKVWEFYSRLDDIEDQMETLLERKFDPDAI